MGNTIFIHSHTHNSSTFPMPFFSIIIPVYNVAPYLRECLDSVMAQTYPNWEAICVDDGSTDGSGAILDEYAAKDSRFRVFHQQNAGVSAARNKGLDEAKGEYIWFVDGDDTAAVNALKSLHGLIQLFDSPDSIVFCISGDNENRGESSAERSYLLQDRTLDAFWRVRGGVCRSLLKREVHGDLRFMPMAMGEDTLFSVLSYYRAKRIVISHQELYQYRRRPGSASTKMGTMRMLRDWMSLQMRLIRILRDNGEPTNPQMEFFFKWNAQYVFYTPSLYMFDLPPQEWRKCRKSWLKLVEMAGKIHKHTWWKYPVLKAISLFPQAIVAKMLIVWPYNARMRLRRLFSAPEVVGGGG